MRPTALDSALVSSPWYVPKDTVSKIAMTKSEKAQNSRVRSETKFSSFSFVSLRIYDILAKKLIYKKGAAFAAPFFTS